MFTKHPIHAMHMVFIFDIITANVLIAYNTMLHGNWNLSLDKISSLPQNDSVCGSKKWFIIAI